MKQIDLPDRPVNWQIKSPEQPSRKPAYSHLNLLPSYLGKKIWNSIQLGPAERIDPEAKAMRASDCFESEQ